MNIGNKSISPWKLGIIMNFNDHTVTWYNDTIQVKDSDAALGNQ
jgi:hypothetical protein